MRKSLSQNAAKKFWPRISVNSANSISHRNHFWSQEFFSWYKDKTFRFPCRTIFLSCYRNFFQYVAKKILSRGEKILVPRKKSCGKKNIVLSLYQEKFSWHQKIFLWRSKPLRLKFHISRVCKMNVFQKSNYLLYQRAFLTFSHAWGPSMTETETQAHANLHLSLTKGSLRRRGDFTKINARITPRLPPV